MQRKPKSYSATLMDQIPIKHLVTQAQGLQQELGGEETFLPYLHNCATVGFHTSRLSHRRSSEAFIPLLAASLFCWV